MAILNRQTDSASKQAPEGEAKQRALADAGYTHVEGAPAPPPLELPHFSLRELRAAIPKHCFERSFVTSTYYLIKDVLTCAALFYTATFIDRAPGVLPFVLWPVYWLFQGIHLMSLWIVAHECGHQAYCSSEVVNNMIGLVLHSALLVPYHSWRISHRKHHSNTASCEHDEVFVPDTRSMVESTWNESLEDAPLYNLFYIVRKLAVGWMAYMFFNTTGPSKYWGKPRSHFSPYSAIFADRERWMILLSDIFLVLMLAVLAVLVHTFSFATMIKFYFVPYTVVNSFVVIITCTQHTDTYTPHFREGEWTWLRGALSTVDRSFGSYLDNVFHRILNTHVCHHLFPKMPFYHCAEATDAIKPILGKFYLKDSTPLSLTLWRSYTCCKFIEDDGKVVFYKNKL